MHAMVPCLFCMKEEIVVEVLGKLEKSRNLPHFSSLMTAFLFFLGGGGALITEYGKTAPQHHLQHFKKSSPALHFIYLSEIWQPRAVS